MESCAQIAGACLEQTTWLRRNLAVREEEPSVTVGTNEKEGSGELTLHVQIYLLVTMIVLSISEVFDTQKDFRNRIYLC